MAGIRIIKSSKVKKVFVSSCQGFLLEATLYFTWSCGLGFGVIFVCGYDLVWVMTFVLLLAHRDRMASIGAP